MARTTRQLVLALWIAGCATTTDYAPRDADDLLIVDCLLPPRIKALGRSVTYLEARKAVRTSAVDCRIRGGEYVAHDRASWSTALEIWLPLARAGDPAAQNYVGEIHERGLGSGPDYEAAAHWFRLAADQGDAAAQVNLGQLYELGRGVPRSATLAQEWYRRASGLAASGAAFVAATAPPSELELLRARLRDKRREAEELERERAALEDALGVLKRSATRDAGRAERVQVREQELAILDSRRAALAAAIAKIEQELAAAEARQGGADPPAAVEVAGPAIQILDPPVPLQRGLAMVDIRPAETRRTLVGRVDAPAGLERLTVNGAPVEPDAEGIFRTELAIARGSLAVRVTAVDRRGKSAERHFELAPLSARAGTAPPPDAPVPEGFGDYHALVVGNDDYAVLPDLRTARRDAAAVARVLRDRYGFAVTLLENASRYQMLSALERFRTELEPGDNLLVYYAGHGELDPVNMRGHWLPVDAEQTSRANWISNVSVTDILNAMRARHVLVVADTCYSGTLTPSALARLDAGSSDAEREAWLEAMARKRSRTALTSGGLVPVLDGGGGDHSVFARFFLEALERNRDVLEGRALFDEISARVTWEARKQRFDQVPEYAPIQFAGHEAGDFFLVPVAGPP